MSARRELEAKLSAVGKGAGERIDLAGAALILAALDRPAVALDPYREHLDALARDLAATAKGAGGLLRRVDALNEVMFRRHGYRGDVETYEDPENADLIRVIDRRKGLPVSLGILSIHAARAQGWKARGLGFPGHFLLRLEQGAERAILDPFHAGRRLEASDLRDLLKSLGGAEVELTPQMHAPVGDRAILLRLQNNIKARALQNGDTARAIAILERMALFAPERFELWEELAVLQARLGKLRSAIGTLEQVLERNPRAPRRERAARLLARLRAALN